jgi:cytochrome c-type biogenesis protein CcsB
MWSKLVATVCLSLSVVFYMWWMITIGKIKSNAPSLTHPNTFLVFCRSGRPATIMLLVSLLFLSISIVIRALYTGHGPFTSMYEFSIAFTWGITAAGIFFQWRYQTYGVSAIIVILALLLLLYSYTLPSQSEPLVPALQQSILLSTHVASAVIAYGTFTIGFGTAILFLFQNHYAISWLPDINTLDEMSYRAVLIGFPFLTLVIILGAIWADLAWGRYWAWDPKETASLTTWLIYSVYLHTRIRHSWKGNRSAVLLIIGFIAVLLTFFGNYIFASLHSYT